MNLITFSTSMRRAYYIDLNTTPKHQDAQGQYSPTLYSCIPRNHIVYSIDVSRGLIKRSGGPLKRYFLGLAIQEAIV